MIITKTPFRVPLAGGGTDIDFYYRKRGGLLISACLKQYVYILILKRELDKKILIQTTSTEFVSNFKKIKHDIIKATLDYFNIKNKIQIGTFSTLPTKSGLGSSSSLIVGLINGFLKLKNIKLDKRKIAKIAYEIERIILKKDGGWQDQIAASYGGLNKISINKKGSFNIQKIKIKPKIQNKIEKNLILIFSNEVRDSSSVIENQRKNLKKRNIIEIYDQIKEKVTLLEVAIKKGDLKNIGNIFNEHWILKRKLSTKISNSGLDKFYIKLMKSNLFYGGKIIGAGGGGFFLMVMKNKKAVDHLKQNNHHFINFRLENSGSKFI